MRIDVYTYKLYFNQHLINMDQTHKDNLIGRKLKTLKNKVGNLGDIFQSVNVSVMDLNSAYRKSAMWQPVYVKDPHSRR